LSIRFFNPTSQKGELSRHFFAGLDHCYFCKLKVAHPTLCISLRKRIEAIFNLAANILGIY